MPQNTKIATCNYCGTRAALVLTGAQRHELACSSCGAPLHELKMMPRAKVAEVAPQPAKPKSKVKTRVVEVPVYREYDRDSRKSKKKSRSKKKRKGWAAWAMEEVWDAVEDIFD